MILIRWFRSLSPLLLAVTVLAMVGALEVEHSFASAADRPAKEQGRTNDVGKQPSASHEEPKRSKAEEDTNAGDANSKESHSNRESRDAKESNSDREKATDKNPQPQSSPTAAARISILEIEVDDPCRVSGVISLSGAYHGSLTLELTYHVTGGSGFSPTATTWSHDFQGQTRANFVLSPALPAGLQVGPDERVNSYRVEVASASPIVDNMTAKSESFHCSDEAVVPAPSPTPTPTSVPTPSATPTSIETPSATPRVTPTPTEAPIATPHSTATPTGVPYVPPSVTPAPTSTPGATLPIVPTPTTAPAATPIPSPTTAPTATPTPSPTALPGGVPHNSTRITPDNSGNANPGAEAIYEHTVFNLGPTSDVKEIRVVSSEGWPVALFTGDGVTPLVDSNQNGTVDTGLIGASQTMRIVVKVAVPPGTTRGTTDTTTVIASSALNHGAATSDAAVNTTTVNGAITISISTSTVDFGSVSPSGGLEPNVPGVWSTADELGAYYVRNRGVRVTVSSNAAWLGTVWAQENNGSASSIRITDGDLEWRLEGDASWTTFQLSPSTFGEGASGSSSQWHDYRLRIQWEDDPGDFTSAVAYHVTQ
jgi:hypothetical protein